MATTKLLPCRCGRKRPSCGSGWTGAEVTCGCGLYVAINVRKDGTESPYARARANMRQARAKWNAIQAACAQAGVTWDR